MQPLRPSRLPLIPHHPEGHVVFFLLDNMSITVVIVFSGFIFVLLLSMSFCSSEESDKKNYQALAPIIVTNSSKL